MPLDLNEHCPILCDLMRPFSQESEGEEDSTESDDDEEASCPQSRTATIVAKKTLKSKTHRRNRWILDIWGAVAAVVLFQASLSQN